jgi:ADP-ribosyl-[dinitrogen reductase] hydrolase
MLEVYYILCIQLTTSQQISTLNVDLDWARETAAVYLRPLPKRFLIPRALLSVSSMSIKGEIIDPTLNTLNALPLNRAVGSLIGMACGDSLGSRYEFGPPLPEDYLLEQVGGGPFDWEPGEWTDDTSMAIPIAKMAAQGIDLLSPKAIEHILRQWRRFSLEGKDCGVQSRAVLSGLTSFTEAEANRASKSFHDERGGMSAGNGALMRTAPVALAYLDDEPRLIEAARRIASLTHFDPRAGEACVIWCLAIRQAILTGEYDLNEATEALPRERKTFWRECLHEAENSIPSDFTNNGYVVQALQGAVSALKGASGAVQAIERAIRGGGDTDTVAAITGSLAGARWGVSSLPNRWRSALHGWPGLKYRDFVNLAVMTAQKGVVLDAEGWPLSEKMESHAPPLLVQHPHDEGVWLGSLSALEDMEESEKERIDVVLALCRVGTLQTMLPLEEFWLIDQPGMNLDVGFILSDVVERITHHRARGLRVMVCCFAAQSRTPAVAAAYSVVKFGISPVDALRDLTALDPRMVPEDFLFREVSKLQRITP